MWLPSEPSTAHLQNDKTGIRQTVTQGGTFQSQKQPVSESCSELHDLGRWMLRKISVQACRSQFSGRVPDLTGDPPGCPSYWAAWLRLLGSPDSYIYPPLTLATSAVDFWGHRSSQKPHWFLPVAPSVGTQIPFSVPGAQWSNSYEYGCW